MGTRGAFGFHADNEDKVTYNHSDSYPDGLGADILAALSGETIEHLRDVAAGLIMVNKDEKPTPEQIELCAPWPDLKVSGQSTEDWYCLLRPARGELTTWTKDGLRVMIDSHGFLLDSLFCEWAYIINLDTEQLEVYKGFNQNPEAPGRYAAEKNPDFVRADGFVLKTEYNGVALVKEIPLEQVFAMADSDRDALIAELEGDEDENSDE